MISLVYFVNQRHTVARKEYEGNRFCRVRDREVTIAEKNYRPGQVGCNWSPTYVERARRWFNKVDVLPQRVGPLSRANRPATRPRWTPG